MSTEYQNYSRTSKPQKYDTTGGVHRTHTPREQNIYGIECYNYSSSADSATPRD